MILVWKKQSNQLNMLLLKHEVEIIPTLLEIDNRTCQIRKNKKMKIIFEVLL